jgi:hypothetical protein
MGFYATYNSRLLPVFLGIFKGQAWQLKVVTLFPKTSVKFTILPLLKSQKVTDFIYKGMEA